MGESGVMRASNGRKAASGRKRMKALSMIFEYVLLFFFSVVICVLSIGIFNGYDSHFNYVSTGDQLTAISEYLGANVMKLAEMKGNEEGSMLIKVPKRLGRENYIIELYSGGLNITAPVTNISMHSDLYNISQAVQLSGKVVSGSGNLRIYKTGNQIIIS